MLAGFFFAVVDIVLDARNASQLCDAEFGENGTIDGLLLVGQVGLTVIPPIFTNNTGLIVDIGNMQSWSNVSVSTTNRHSIKTFMLS